MHPVARLRFSQHPAHMRLHCGPATVRIVFKSARTMVPTWVLSATGRLVVLRYDAGENASRTVKNKVLRYDR